VNARLELLEPYPFERLRSLIADIKAPALDSIRLSVGEPQHPSPPFVHEALISHPAGLSTYPLTTGSEQLREAIAAWFSQRFSLERLNAADQVLPVNGSREALFAFAQCIIDGDTPGALVACPNPFYQIYEGAALLAGATPVFLNQTAANHFDLELETLTPSAWKRVELLYLCSPGNPSGRVLRLDEWRRLFEYADRYDFVIASDECYSEIYFDDSPPLGGLDAAQRLGRIDYRRLVVFTSLSKRSNVPGLRSGAVAGDASILRQFLRYRTYHGCAMSPAVQHASIAAWRDESHVRDNRLLYRSKFDTLVPMLAPVLDAPRPEAGFYLWASVPPAWNGDDERFVRDLMACANVLVLPGRYLARDAHGENPGAGRVRIALVATHAECVEAARRIIECCEGPTPLPTTHAPASA
jgi:N-succinyldiaminopimelate aminotransferase